MRYEQGNIGLLHGTGSKKQLELNRDIEAFIFSKDQSGESYTESDLDYIRGYEGNGGLASKGGKGAGILHEFYTPYYIVELMWKLAVHYGYKGGTVLEPSMGTGRFVEKAPNPSKVTGFEIDGLSFRIAELLTGSSKRKRPKLFNRYFETAFLKAPRFTSRLPKFESSLEDYPFGLVIGNPPFGVHKNQYSGFFKRPNLRQIEFFFFYYGLQLLKKGGLLVFITSQNLMSTGGTYYQIKQKIGEIAELVDAVRIPPVFKNTNVPMDIIILKRK